MSSYKASNLSSNGLHLSYGTQQNRPWPWLLSLWVSTMTFVPTVPYSYSIFPSDFGTADAFWLLKGQYKCAFNREVCDKYLTEAI